MSAVRGSCLCSGAPNDGEPVSMAWFNGFCLASDSLYPFRPSSLDFYGQPILSLREGRIKSLEGLLRWHHPERGLISPSEFIPIAEETGFIVPLGEWVLRTACAEAANWNAGIDVAVNVSAVLPPGRLVVEITESIFLENTSSNLES